MLLNLIVWDRGGIGAATARLLAKRGCSIAVHYHSNASKAEELVKELQGLAAGPRIFRSPFAQRSQMLMNIQRNAQASVPKLSKQTCSHTTMCAHCTLRLCRNWARLIFCSTTLLSWDPCWAAMAILKIYHWRRSRRSGGRTPVARSCSLSSPYRIWFGNSGGGSCLPLGAPSVSLLPGSH
jgi:hypothetical protein